MTNEDDCVELGLACADVCTALSRGLDGKLLKDLNNSVSEAINQLTTWVTSVAVSSERLIDDVLDRSTLAEIQREIIKKGKQNVVSRLFHAKNDKEAITNWKSDLNKILLVFNVSSVVVAWLHLTVRYQTELALNTNTMVSDMHHIIVKSRGMFDGKDLPVSVTRVPHLSRDERLPLFRLKPGQ